MNRLHATEVGQRIALSGLLPETAHFLLDYLCKNSAALSNLLPDDQGNGGDVPRLNFSLLSSVLMSPEFTGLTRTRFIHFGFDATAHNPLASKWGNELAGQPWQAYRSSVNSAALIMEWISGAQFSALEKQYQAVRAGTFEGLCRDATWCLSGLADIVASATKFTLEVDERPVCLRSTPDDSLNNIRRLLPSLRLLSWRLSLGLPETVVWLTEAQGVDGRPLIRRREALALHQKGLGNYNVLRQRNNWNDVVEALRGANVPDAQSRAALIQKLAGDWHMSLREKFKKRQVKCLDSSRASQIENFYQARGTDFEEALEALLNFANISFTRFDCHPKQGAFDYLLHFVDRPDFPLECKSKVGQGLVALNEATDVLRATDIHGYPGVQCATLCQPGVDPNVPSNLLGCARLCVVEAHDLAEAIISVALEQALPSDLHDWLSQPGQAKLETFIPTSKN